MEDGKLEFDEYLAIYDSVPASYYEWMFDRIKHFVQGSVLEIGSGPGILSQLLLDQGLQVTGIDLDPGVVDRLNDQFAGVDNFRAVLGDATKDDLSALPGAPFDTIVCLNTLEHFRDDLGTLKSFHQALKPGGRLAVLVPAHPSLYGTMDELFGHVQRYTRSGLLGVLQEAGFRSEVEWFNMLGIPGWWWRFRVCKRPDFNPWQNKVYEALIPAMKAVESRIRVPVGLSLITLSEKI